MHTPIGPECINRSMNKMHKRKWRRSQRLKPLKQSYAADKSRKFRGGRPRSEIWEQIRHTGAFSAMAARPRRSNSGGRIAGTRIAELLQYELV
jgi:hypothetical protein